MVSFARYNFSILLVLTAILLAGPGIHADRRALESRHEISLGAGPVYFQPLGYFGEQFNGGFGGLLQVKIPGTVFLSSQPFAPFTLFLDSAFLFSSQSLAARSTGSISTLSLTAGPGLLYHLHYLFQPVMSVHLGFFYNQLTLASRGETYHAYNPAVRLQAGFHSHITDSLFIESRVALPFYYLGERNLLGPEFAVSANYLLKPAELIMTRADKHFLNGKKLYEEKKYAEADTEFAIALKSDAGHAGALNYRRMILAHEQLARARNAREKQEIWNALAQYQQAALALSEAEQELREYRATLVANVPTMVTEGIAHYEARRYADCERAMEHVLLIQPENEQARIYLPRARSRRQALEKLQ